MATESQNAARAQMLAEYLYAEMTPAFEALGFVCRKLTDDRSALPLRRTQGGRLASTVLGYGHGDVTHGLDDDWDAGLSPWKLTERECRWYGRGVADNKGQHSINIAALRAVLEARGNLGFNAKYLIEMGEEVGSPGLRELSTTHEDLFRADVLIASDGPRLSADRPTV